MKRPLIIALAALAVAGPAMAQDGTRWHMARLGAEACVPLDDVSPAGERLYYGTGDMHTPADFKQMLERMGTRVTLGPEAPQVMPSIVPYVVTFPDGDVRLMPLFDTEALCRFTMKHVPR